MSRLRSYLVRLGEFSHRKRRDHELAAELESHLQMHVEDNLRAGMDAIEARRQALIKFGGMESTVEAYRERRGLSFGGTVLQDLRYAVRMLKKNPGFTAVAVITLALGIGANTAIFGLVDSAFLRAMPFREPEKLVHFWTTEAGGETHSPTREEYLALRKDGSAFQQVAATGWASFFYGGDEVSWRNLPGLLVTANWLPTLGVQPLLGRNFLPEEEFAGHEDVVILSYRCWRTRFRGNPLIIGKQMVLNRRPVTVIGVLPQSLTPYYSDVEIFAPLVIDSYTKAGFLIAGKVRLLIVARLKQGVTLAQARAEAEGIAQQLRSPNAPNDGSGHLVVEHFANTFWKSGPTAENARRGLWMMALAAGAVLLIACANVASLLLARGVKRQREAAIRAAFGCSRARMIQQLLIESAVLFLCGGILGLLVARWSQEVITKTVSTIVWGRTYLEINTRIFAISLGISLASALFFGMIPAMQAVRANVNENLKDASRNVVGRSRSKPREFLVMFQVAVGMVLLVCFGLLFRSWLHVESSALGFDPHNVLTVGFNPPASGYITPSDETRIRREAIEAARSVPGVEAAGTASFLPMDGADSSVFRIQSPFSERAPTEQEIFFVPVGPDYFSALKIGMAAGRAFRDSDDVDSSSVVIVNRTFAKTYFPRLSPIGYHVALADAPTKWREIVGVVSDFRQRNPEEDLRPVVYLPLAQAPSSSWSMVVRIKASNDNGVVAKILSNRLLSIDPQLYWQFGTMEEKIQNSESLTMRRPIIMLLASFGTISLVLVVVGVFGVTAYSVSERTQEIGIRVALGAARVRIAGLVLRESLMVALAGMALGMLCAFVLAHFLPDTGIGWSGSGIFLYRVSRTDPLTYALAATLLAAVVFAATYIPARRASRVDPMVALRYE